ncbi:MAG: filamentous hemagglutinin N-terminal domain-containing protein [Oceanospirillaceae bacterium]|nr:filamentous hemagglutinin N-terminal domain-containing protein [Oceanospirillaceae bacterium]
MKTLKVHLAPYYLICFCLPAFSPAGHALPAMPVTEQGSASVSISGNRMDITQHSDLLISRHSQYDVGAAESVVYLQPSSSALAIAKIDGGMSQILGHISANGRLWLVNANGFFVGQNASLDTAGLMLASHDLQQDGAGFSLQQGPGSITNLGSITVQGDGQLTLLSRQVDNQGQLSSGGDLLINTGERLLLQPKGQGFAVEVQQNSNAGQIRNSGDMQGHYVALNADRNISSAEITINNTGNISAVAVLENNGEVYLSARGGDVIQDGTVQAAGGLIDIHADTYLQQGQLDASAAPGQNANGGMVNLWADKGFELSGSSRIAANASGYGNGGQLNLISPGYALLHSGGWLSARGGELGGNGGFAELSGWQFVLSNGLADMRAPKGAAGTYLIDPYNIEIIAGSTDTNTAFGAGSYTASNTPAQIGADNITTQLGLGNVTISTAGAGGEAGDITITGAVDLTGSNGNTLTFTADGSIAINNDLTNTADSTNISMTAGGNITFSAGSQIDAGAGTISLTSGGSTQLRSGSLQTTSASNTAISVTTTNNLTGSTDDSADIIATNGGISLTAGAISSLELNVKKAGFNTSGVSGVSVRVQGDMELTALSLAASAPLGILGFSTNSNRMGTLTLPTTGITVSGALNLYTADILDGDGGDVIINNSSATSIQLNNPAAARSFELGIGNTGLTVGNAQGLTAKNSTGNLQVSGTLSGGNLTLSSSGNMQISSLSGAASLNASATGSITIPDAGLSTTSAITLNGTDIIDSTAPRAITLNTSSLNVTTALAGGDTSISTTATSLAVNKGTATGLLSVNKSNAGNLTVSTVDSGDGDLSLNLTNGDLIVSDTHLQTTGTLTVVANDIHDSDRIVTLNGTLLDITLNGTNINGLTLRGLANTSVAIAGTSATDLTLLSDSGSFTVTSMANWAGAVTLDAASRITVPDTGISSDSTLTVNAGYIRSASSGTSATLNGGFGLVLDLGLGNGSATINTTSLFGTIITSGTSNTLTLNKTDAGDFDLGSASISGGLNIALNNGTLTLPASITVPGTLTLNANDLNDTTINGGTLALSLDALADALTLNTALDNASINITGANQTFSLTETDDLNLSSFTSTGNEISPQLVH